MVNTRGNENTEFRPVGNGYGNGYGDGDGDGDGYGDGYGDGDGDGKKLLFLHSLGEDVLDDIALTQLRISL